MGMGIGINVHTPDAGKIRGRQEPVACGVWYTSTGTAIPKLIKFQGEDGEIRTLTNLHVLSFEKKNYCGIPTVNTNVMQWSMPAAISSICSTM